MKDETKNKIKNGVKYTAISVGLILLFLLGVGIGSCSEKAQSKRAIETSAIDAGGTNYMDTATVFSGYGLSCNSSRYIISYTGLTSCAVFDPLPDGLYYFLFNGNADRADLIGVDSVIPSQLSNGVTGTFDNQGMHAWNLKRFNGASVITYNVSNVSELTNKFVLSFDNGNLPIGIYSETDYWSYVAPVSYSVDFPKNNWFPYQLLGNNQSPVIFGPAQSAPNSSRSIDIDGVYFRSAGRLWSGLTIQYSSLSSNDDAIRQGVPPVYGVLDEYGEWVWNKQVGTSTYLWYVSSVKYKPFEGGLYVPVGGQRLKQYDDYSQAVTQIFDWASDLFRHIEIVYDSGALITSVGGTPLTASEWLITLAENVFDGSKTPDGALYDVFDMFAGAFDSFASVMNIQILPYMTIGMLMFIPLIVIIVLAIVRLLNK